MAQYTNKGLYNSYDKNNKEREALDYYATPTEEVTNILENMKLKLDNSTILEPCCGGGHMVEGIVAYLNKINANSTIYATDIKNRGFCTNNDNIIINTGKEQDFFSDNYGDDIKDDIDYVIMNPPYGVIEPFVIRALEIPKKGLLMLGRLQFIEGEKRYEKIFKDSPPTDIYVYIDRIACYRDGDFSKKQSSAQAYAWFYWDMEQKDKKSEVHWIRRSDKKGSK